MLTIFFKWYNHLVFYSPNLDQLGHQCIQTFVKALTNGIV